MNVLSLAGGQAGTSEVKVDFASVLWTDDNTDLCDVKFVSVL